MVPKLAEGLRVVDADSHMTERHDLFTERAPKGYEDRVPHVERIDGVDMWVIEGQTVRQGRLGRHHRPRGQEAPLRRLAGRDVGHRRRAPGGVGSQGAAPPDGRARHRHAGAVPELHGPRRAEPLQHRRGQVRRPALHRALQRRHGGGAGGVGPPAAAHADHAGLGHCGLRPRGAALRRHGLPGRQHDGRPAGLGVARPGRPGLGPLLGGLRRYGACRCTSTSAPARPRSPTSGRRTGRARTTT